MSGYTDCACRDCFDIAIGDADTAMCHDCEVAGCEPHDGECCRDDAYGSDSAAKEESA